MAASTYRLISKTEYYIPIGNKMYRKTEILEEVVENTTSIDLTSESTSPCPSETYCPSETSDTNTPQECTCHYHLMNRENTSPESFARYH